MLSRSALCKSSELFPMPFPPLMWPSVLSLEFHWICQDQIVQQSHQTCQGFHCLHLHLLTVRSHCPDHVQLQEHLMMWQLGYLIGFLVLVSQCIFLMEITLAIKFSLWTAFFRFSALALVACVGRGINAIPGLLVSNIRVLGYHMLSHVMFQICRLEKQKRSHLNHTVIKIHLQ